MVDTSFPTSTDVLTSLLKAGTAVPKNRVLAFGVDGKIYPASYNSGNVFGVSTKEIVGSNSGVSFASFGDIAIFTADSAITRGDKIMVSNTGSGMVRTWSATGEVGTGETQNMSFAIDGWANYVGCALEAAASSGDSFRGLFKPIGW